MSMINCKECGKEISSSAKVCPLCGKKLKPSVWQLIVGIIICLIGVNLAINGAMGMNGYNANNIQMTSTQHNNFSTKENYDKIEEGMTEEEVKNILGNPNSSSETNNSELGRIKIKRYQNKKTIIDIYFHEGKVYMKNITKL